MTLIEDLKNKSKKQVTEILYNKMDLEFKAIQEFPKSIKDDIKILEQSIEDDIKKWEKLIEGKIENLEDSYKNKITNLANLTPEKIRAEKIELKKYFKHESSKRVTEKLIDTVASKCEAIQELKELNNYVKNWYDSGLLHAKMLYDGSNLCRTTVDYDRAETFLLKFYKKGDARRTNALGCCKKMRENANAKAETSAKIISKPEKLSWFRRLINWFKSFFKSPANIVAGSNQYTKAQGLCSDTHTRTEAPNSVGFDPACDFFNPKNNS